jgi:hypothetical protein
VDVDEVRRRVAEAGVELDDDAVARVAELLERVLAGAAALEDELELDGVEPFA